MENFDEVIFDDDEFGEIQPDSQEGEETLPSNPEESSNLEEDLTTEVLRLKGISDPDKIKFEDESGAVIERAWNQLSRNEQLTILAGEEPSGYNLHDAEVKLINSIRESNMSVDEYINSLIEQLIPVLQPVYEVDSLSDEELYALDLLEKVGSDNISDEELTEAINAAKQNETIFKKTVEGLRKEYIQLQQEEEARKNNEQLALREEAYNRFASSILGEITNLNSFAGQDLELSNDDIEDLSSFMLDLDDSGMSAFGRAMNDPALFTKAAFFILNEELIVEEINKLILENFRRGYETAKRDMQNNTPKMVYKPASSKKTTEDAFIDDEEW